MVSFGRFLRRWLVLTIWLPIFAILPLRAPLSDARGGFDGPPAQPSVRDVKSALAAEAGALCSLKGKIREKLSGRRDRYLFADSTGLIVARISKEQFGNVIVTPDHIVLILGEIRADAKYPNEVDVSQIHILPSES